MCARWATCTRFSAIRATMAKVNAGCRSAGIGCIECKGWAADALVNILNPMQERRKKYRGQSAAGLGYSGEGPRNGPARWPRPPWSGVREAMGMSLEYEGRWRRMIRSQRRVRVGRRQNRYVRGRPQGSNGRRARGRKLRRRFDIRPESRRKVTCLFRSRWRCLRRPARPAA